jgi:chloramphenicol 3-O phosphotransferase
VVDVGHHDAYSQPLGILPEVARRLHNLPALFVGVRCPIDVIMQRRDAAPVGYEVTTPDGGVPDPVLRWQEQVHRPGIYDLEVDTSELTPAEAAARIRHRLDSGPPPTAFARLAEL